MGKSVKNHGKRSAAFQECPVHGRVEHPGFGATVAEFYDTNRLLMPHSTVIRTVVPQSIVDVADRYYTGFKGDLFS